MREDIELSREGFFAIASFIGQLWSMQNLGITANPTKYIMSDVSTQRHIDHGIYDTTPPLFESKETN